MIVTNAAQNSKLDAALAAAGRGLQVFPLKEKSKTPAVPWKDVATDEAAIQGWYHKNPEYNLAAKTGKVSGIVVIDVDRKSGGMDWYEQISEWGQMPATLTAITGDGGRHVYLQHPGGEVRNSVSSIASGVDMKGDSGYVVLPPSIHPDTGNAYEWLDPDAPIAEVPDWLLKHMTAPAPRERTEDAEVDVIPEGKRNVTLASYAGTLRHRGCTEDAIVGSLLSINETMCDPPLAEDEVERIARSIGRKKAGRIIDATPSSVLTVRSCADSAQNDGEWTEDDARLWIVKDDEPGTVAFHPRPRLHLSGECRSIAPVIWTVPGFCKAGTVSMVYGEPGDGKTLALMDQGLAIATGTDWAGLPTRQQTVLYIDLDNGEHELARRDGLLRAGRRLAPDLSVPFFYVAEEEMNLLTPAGRACFQGRCAECNPGVIYVDALSDTWEGGDENGSQEILPILRFLAREALANDRGIIAIHHPTKVGKTFRGTGAIKQKVGTLHRFTAQNDKQKTFHGEKNRYGKRQDLPIGIAFDADDTECVVTGTPGTAENYQPIMNYVGSNPGCTIQQMIAADVGNWQEKTLRDYVGRLIKQKDLVNESPNGKAGRYRIAA